MARKGFDRFKFRRELRKLTREIEKEAKKMKVEIPVKFVNDKPESEGNSTLKDKATKVLQVLHDRVNGATTKLADLREISKELGYSEEEFDTIWMYLHRQNWIKGFSGGHALITVDGIEYLEQKDDKPPVRPLIQQNMYVYGSQNNVAQAGEHAEVNYISNDSSRQLIDAALQLIDELKKDTSVKPEDRTEAIDLVETVKDQVETHGEPKPGIVRSTLRKLNEIGAYVSNGTALYKFLMDFQEILKRFSL